MSRRVVRAGQGTSTTAAGRRSTGHDEETVGGAELALRAVAGPALLLAGLTVLGARQGRPAGLVALAWGALVTETAMTRTCSVNGVLGRDTAR